MAARQREVSIADDVWKLSEPMALLDVAHNANDMGDPDKIVGYFFYLTWTGVSFVALRFGVQQRKAQPKLAAFAIICGAAQSLVCLYFGYKWLSIS